jgi:RNAse (barnase) inhibitor barstar
VAGKTASLVMEVVAKVDDAVGGLKKVSDSASGFDKLKTAAAGIGAVAGAEMVAAGKAAMEYQTTLTKLQTTYSNVGMAAGDAKEGLDAVEATTRRTGQSTEDASAAYNSLVLATKNSKTAMTDLKLAEDLAAFSGTSVSDAADTIIKAQEGQTRGLKALGIATTDVNGKALDQAQIMQNLTDAVHGQADAYGNTAAGQMARFHEGLGQLQVSIGQALMPVIQQVTGFLGRMADVMNQHQEIVKILVPLIGGLAAAIVAVQTAVKIWTAVQTALDVVLNANPIGLIVAAIAALVAGVILAYQHIGWFHDAVQAVWNVIKSFVDFITAHWKLMVDIILGPLGILLTNLDKVKAIFNDIINVLGKVKQAASDAFGWLGKVAGGAGGVLSHIPGIGSIFSLSAPTSGMMVANFSLMIAPGDDFPEAVYRGLREYQRRHVRPELAGMFGRR